MKIKFYVITGDSNVYSCFLLGVNSRDNYLLGNKSRENNLNENSRRTSLNAYLFHFFLNEISNCVNFKYRVARNIKSHDSPFIIEIQPNQTEYIDRTW